MKYIASFVVSLMFFTVAMGYLADEKVNLKKPRVYFCYFITLILYVLNFEFSLSETRFIFNVLIFMIFSAIWLKTDIKSSIVLGILITLLGTLSEVAYVLIAGNFINDALFLADSPLSVLINNIFIGCILLILCRILNGRKIYQKVLKGIDKISDKKVALLSLSVIILFNVAYIITYLVSKEALHSLYLPVFSAVLSFLAALLVFVYLQTNNKYLTIYGKYNTSLQSIKEFEALLEYHRINSHENKNQLRTIKYMSKDESVKSYVQTLLNDKENDKEKLFANIQKIPEGGLRGIIYSKLLLMNSENIPFELVVDKKITHEMIENIDDVTMKDLCNVLGVLLDNAIEASSSLEEKYVLIELYKEKESIIISVTNRYEGYIDLEQINNPGNSTKGKNHGYGLSLVDYIINHNKKLIHKNELIEDNFMQSVQIKV